MNFIHNFNRLPLYPQYNKLPQPTVKQVDFIDD